MTHFLQRRLSAAKDFGLERRADDLKDFGLWLRDCGYIDPGVVELRVGSTGGATDEAVGELVDRYLEQR